MNIRCQYEWDGHSGVMLPSMLLVDSPGFDWTTMLEISLEAPFESFDTDLYEEERLSLTVPDHVYVRSPNSSGTLRLSMPLLARFAERLFAESFDPPQLHEIGRLVLRLSDIEDMLFLEPGVRPSRSRKSSFND